MEALCRRMRTIQKVMQNFSIRETAQGTPLNRTSRIRDLVSYFLRGAVQVRSAIQAQQRAEAAR
jgi:hypothetical protein